MKGNVPSGYNCTILYIRGHVEGGVGSYWMLASYWLRLVTWGQNRLLIG